MNYKDLSEPSFYYHNWGYKWAVEAQINGDPQLNYSGTHAQAAWMAWGPNFWADGKSPVSMMD